MLQVRKFASSQVRKASLNKAYFVIGKFTDTISGDNSTDRVFLFATGKVVA